MKQDKCARCDEAGFLVIEDVERRAIKECPDCKGSGLDAQHERDLWIKRWNTVRNYLLEHQEDGDRSNPETGTLREIEGLMITLETTYDDEPVGGSAANNSEEEEQ